MTGRHIDKEKKRQKVFERVSEMQRQRERQTESVGERQRER